MLLDLLLGIGFWLIYFSIVFFPLRSWYDRLVGPRPPEHPAHRFKEWTERQTRVKRRFIAIGIGLGVLPLLVRFVVSVSG